MTTDQLAALDDRLVSDVLRAALASGGSFAELYAEDRTGRSLHLDDRRIEEVTSGRDLGAGIRVIREGRTGYAFTNVLRPRELLDAARVAGAAVAGEQRARVADLRRVSPTLRHQAERDPTEADGPAMVEVVRRAEDAARAVSGEVRQVTVGWVDTRQDILIANSEGHRSDERRVRVRLVVQVVAARDGLIQTAHEGPGAAVGLELLDRFPPEAVGRKVAERAVAMLDSIPAPSGEMAVVLAPGSGGVLFHEACGHGMEADIVAKGGSVYAGRRGERIGTSLVSGVDDATLPGAWGSFGLDDEGTPAQRTVLFADGVCTDYLSDRLTAAALGLPRSGNARRQSYAHLPFPRMTNTLILPGQDDPGEIVAGVRHGLYCDVLGGGQVDPASGEFVFGVSQAHLIEDGELTHLVRGANLVGDGPTVLGRIDAVGDDFDLRQGICGKEGQGVPAGLGNPTVRISAITVGGVA